MPTGKNRDRVVASVIGREGTHNCQAVCSLGKLGQCAAKPNARQLGSNLSGATSVVRSDIDFRVEGLDLGRAALQEQKDNRFVPEYITVHGGLGLGRPEAGHCQAAQASDTEKVAASQEGRAVRKPGVSDGQHRLGAYSVDSQDFHD